MSNCRRSRLHRLRGNRYFVCRSVLNKATKVVCVYSKREKVTCRNVAEYSADELLTNTVRFHLWCNIDGVAEQTIARHLATHHSSYHRSYKVISCGSETELLISARTLHVSFGRRGDVTQWSIQVWRWDAWTQRVWGPKSPSGSMADMHTQSAADEHIFLAV